MQKNSSHVKEVGAERERIPPEECASYDERGRALRQSADGIDGCNGPRGLVHGAISCRDGGVRAEVLGHCQM